MAKNLTEVTELVRREVERLRAFEKMDEALTSIGSLQQAVVECERDAATARGELAQTKEKVDAAVADLHAVSSRVAEEYALRKKQAERELDDAKEAARRCVEKAGLEASAAVEGARGEAAAIVAQAKALAEKWELDAAESQAKADALAASIAAASADLEAVNAKLDAAREAMAKLLAV